jgi:hypothetical protein
VSLVARVPLTVRHYYDFGAERERVGEDLVNPGSWDEIRETSGPFGLPATRELWELAASDPNFAARAEKIAAVANGFGARRICSYGVGAAFLELNLARVLPDAELVCTDFAPRTVMRLAQLFPEAEVRVADLKRDRPVEADFHVLHRVDSELSNREWRGVIARFHEPALLVATELLEWPSLLRELRLHSSRGRASRAGYVRSEAALRSLWRRTHRDERIEVADLTGFLLLPR